MAEGRLGRALGGGWRSWTRRSHLLGVALPFVVAFVCSSIDLSVLLLLWLPFLLGVAGAAVLRSWRAPFEIPLAITIGTLLSSVLTDGLHPTEPGFIAVTVLFVFSALIPATIGAAIGVPLGHELEQLVTTDR